jgi:hypothetical protein
MFAEMLGDCFNVQPRHPRCLSPLHPRV